MKRTLWALAALTAALASAFPAAVQAQDPQQQGQQRQERRGGRGFGGRGGGASLLSIPEVQKELKLEQAQIDLIQGLRNNSFNRDELRSLTPEQRRERFAQIRQQQEKQLAEILDAKQLARLKELEIQQAGVRALQRPSVQEALRLTPAQKEQLQAASTAEREAMRQVLQGFRGNGGQQVTPEQRQQAFEKMRALGAETETKIMGILTDAQKKQFQALKGAPFTFPQRQRRARGGNPA